MVAANERNSLDVVLGEFKTFGKYHGAMGTLVILGLLTNGMYCINYVFVTESVAYRCTESIQQCPMSNITFKAATREEVCAKSCGNLTGDSMRYCGEWEYEDTSSFVAQFQLACQEWKRTMVGTLHSFGYMVGLLLMGPMSDRWGRKAVTIFTGVTGALFGLMRSFTTIYWLYLIFEFLEACIGDICSALFMFGVEIVATEKRPMFTAYLTMGYPIGGMLIALVAWLTPDWRTYLRVIYTPGLLFITYWYFMDESPRWLLSKKRNAEAVEILNKAADLNKIENIKPIIKKLEDEVYETKSIRLPDLLKSTLKSKVLLCRFLICLSWWTTCTFTSYGMSLNSVALEGNKYLNYFFLCLAEVPAAMLVGYALMIFSRKWLLFVAFMLQAVFCLSQPFMPTDHLWLSTTIFMAGKCMCTLSFNVVYIFTSELFPTYTRNSMHALCSSLGRVGSIIAQQTPLLLFIWAGLPSMLFGGAALTAGLLTLLVPDTSEDSLPDTVEQAETVGAGQKKTAC